MEKAGHVEGRRREEKENMWLGVTVWRVWL